MNLSDLNIIIAGITIGGGLWALMQVGYQASEVRAKLQKENKELKEWISEKITEIDKHILINNESDKHSTTIIEMKLSQVKSELDYEIKDLKKRMLEVEKFLEKDTDYKSRYKEID